jgi:hypothetical protein
MNFKFEYHGEIEFIQGTLLVYKNQGTRWVLLREKIWKIPCQCTFNLNVSSAVRAVKLNLAE